MVITDTAIELGYANRLPPRGVLVRPSQWRAGLSGGRMSEGFREHASGLLVPSDIFPRP
jgi:hypothetical protein